MFVVLFVMVSTFLTNEAATFVPKYLYQQSYQHYTARSLEYNISVVADKDKDSKGTTGWESTLQNGVLARDPRTGAYSVEWTDQVHIKSKMNEDGRGMELSDLTFYNNRLFSFDDRTGIVYEIDSENMQVIARHILTDGNGRSNKGFKCEWSTVKDGLLYVGGLGKEWTNAEGKLISRDPQYVKTIDVNGKVEHISWVHVYESLREATGHKSPGYLIHEAVRFNPENRRWYFLPRRASTEEYNDVLDETRGSNIVISTNEFFGDIETFHIGEKIPSHGFSAFAFVPYREHEVVALKTEEVEGTIATYITVFDFKKKTVLLEETKIGDVKFEGVEFL
jgi:soluble calcium-activated nucleotidase 1